MNNVARIFEQFLNNPKVHNLFMGGRGGGKSRFVAWLIIKIMCVAPLNVLCGREIQKSLKESSFQMLEQEIYRQGKAHLFTITPSQGTIKSSAGGKAVFIGLQQHTIDSIKSYEGFHWFWGEEAQSFAKESLEILIPTLRTDGWFEVDLSGRVFKFPLRMFIYTMNPYSWDDPINFVLPDTREDTNKIEINYYDNPWFPESLEKERIEAEKSMHPDEYNRIWEGVPYEDSERAIMARAQVEAAMKREASKDGGIVVGADIARFGTDKTVFIKREGLQVIDIKVLHQKDTQEVARRLAEFAGKDGAINLDDTGVGGGVTDKLKDMGLRPNPINFGSRAKNKKKYPDIISEMWFNLADQIGEIGLQYNRDLLTELASRHYKYTNDERRKVESKEDYKKRTGRGSPDMADALILCYYRKRPAMQAGGM